MFKLLGLFEDSRICSLCEDDHLPGILWVFDYDRHSFPAGERNHIDQFIEYLLFPNVELKVSLGPFDKLITNSFGKVDKANFVWTRALILLLQIIPNDFVANHHCLKKRADTFIFDDFLRVAD